MSIYGHSILTKNEVKEFPVRSFTESEMLAITLEAFAFMESDDEEEDESDDAITEGANIDALKEYKKALSSYKDKIRIAKKCIKKTNMKEARNYTKSALKDIKDAKAAIKSLDSSAGSIAFAWVIEALYIAITVTFPFAYTVYCLSLFHTGFTIGLSFHGVKPEEFGVPNDVKEFVKDSLKEPIAQSGEKTVLSAGGFAKLMGVLSGLITLLADVSTLVKQSKEMKDSSKGNIFQAKLLKDLDMLEAEVKKLESKIDVSNLGKEKE